MTDKPATDQPLPIEIIEPDMTSPTTGELVITKRNRSLVRPALSDEGIDLIQEWAKCYREIDDPITRMQSILGMMPYCYPKLPPPKEKPPDHETDDARANELLKELEAIHNEKKVIEVTAVSVHNIENG